MEQTDHLTDLNALLDGEVLNDEETLKAFSRDASVFEMKPQLVVSPKHVKDIQSLVRYASEHRDEGFHITPRAAGTCMSGGSLTQSVVVDLMKHFNKVKSIESGYAITQPGVYYRDFDKQTQRKGQYLPPYPASRRLCAVGGMVGNNAAGEQTLCYGATIDFVRKLKVVLADGNEYEFKPLTTRELEKKLAQKDFEGEVYRKIHRMLVEHKELIQEARPQTTKNSMGYYLWDVMKDNLFDLTKLIVGSQGTLGIITEIEFALERQKKHHSLLVIQMPTLDGLDQVVNDVLKFSPQCFECFDDQTMKYALKFFSEIKNKFKVCSGARIYTQFIPDFAQLMTNTMPKLTLIADFASDNFEAAHSQAIKAQAVVGSMGLNTKLLSSPEFTEKYWVVRRESFSLLRGHADHMTSAPIIDDVCVQPSVLPEYLPELFSVLHKYDKYVIHTLAGHIGSGNFHIIPLMDLNNEKVRSVVPKLVDEVHNLTLAYKGTLAAEHNDGLMRGPYLSKMFGPQVYKLFQEVKDIFDPKGIFNPNKKVNITMKQALKYLHYN